ncbi:phosphoenolpyruvate synthase [Halobacteriales archaeon QH_10_70_21]|nr:MAG: phosphoenolpyruvate synthase [Halobacteriales archaeon QH_10_70_21]
MAEPDTRNVLWLDDVRSDDIGSVGGKGASLGEMTAAGLPVPPGFVVTAETYRTFIEETGIDEPLFEAVEVDPEDSAALAEAEATAKELILETELPEPVRDRILSAYDDLDDGEAFVAVRSSATAEDLPDASFAGQQETFLNITREDLVDRVKRCWASLFTQRAIYYRNEQGFDHDVVDIAVVVQKMVDAEKSGVMFTSHPSTGEPKLIIEAAWGLGEAVVAGSVSPDNYVVDRETSETLETTVADKKVMMVKDEATGETVEREVAEDRRNAQVLEGTEIGQLVELGERAEAHYDEPQDVEWAIVEGDIYMLQSRPITTISEQAAEEAATDGNGDVLVSGLGASPGIASGPARVVQKLDGLDKVGEGDVIVTEMTTPDMVPAMKRASGIGTEVLGDGQAITIDGDKGSVTEGASDAEAETEPLEDVRPQNPVKPMTATEVKVNVSIPEAAERAAATGADGVGLLRTEHMILSTNKTPERYIEDHGAEAYIDEIVGGVRGVADEFYPRPVRVRTLDAPTDEFRQLEGGEDEPHEHNPMLGYRGIRRSLDRPDVFRHELEAFRQLFEMGYDNVEIMFPLVNDAEDVIRARNLLEEAGVDPDKRSWGVMIETPASALGVEGMAEAGIDFASFGTNDLTQYTLAVDRNNGNVADRFDELHPEMVRFLVDEGVSSISANIDAVRDVQHEVKRVEQQLLLDSVR